MDFFFWCSQATSKDYVVRKNPPDDRVFNGSRCTLSLSCLAAAIFPFSHLHFKFMYFNINKQFAYYYYYSTCAGYSPACVYVQCRPTTFSPPPQNEWISDFICKYCKMCGGKSRRYQRLAAPVKQIGMCNRNKAVVSLYNILFGGGAVVSKLQGYRYDF